MHSCIVRSWMHCSHDCSIGPIVADIVSGMPRKKNKIPSPSCGSDVDTDLTTVILFRLPYHMTAEHLVSLLDNDYFSGYNYFYFPMDERTGRNTGIACINFRSHCTARAFKKQFQGFRAWPTGNARRKCIAAWSDVHQHGLFSLIVQPVPDIQPVSFIEPVPLCPPNPPFDTSLIIQPVPCCILPCHGPSACNVLTVLQATNI